MRPFWNARTYHSAISVSLWTARQRHCLQNRLVTICNLMNGLFCKGFIKSNVLINAHHCHRQIRLRTVIPHCLQLIMLLGKVCLEPIGHSRRTLLISLVILSISGVWWCNCLCWIWIKVFIWVRKFVKPEIERTFSLAAPGALKKRSSICGYTLFKCLNFFAESVVCAVAKPNVIKTVIFIFLCCCWWSLCNFWIFKVFFNLFP